VKRKELELAWVYEGSERRVVGASPVFVHVVQVVEEQVRLAAELHADAGRGLGDEGGGGEEGKDYL
jgi:hypothetical protein